MENPFISAPRRNDLIFNGSSNNNNIILSCHAEHASAKRQLFLRSYQFSRKRSVSDRIKGYAVRVKRVILFRLRSAGKLRRLAWSALCFRRGRRPFRFLRLVNYAEVSCFDAAAGMRHRKSSCLW